MSKKHFYIKFDDSVPNSIEKEYNRIVRSEEYLLEKDVLGSADLFGDENELYKYNLAEILIHNENEKSENEEKQQKLILLRKALIKLKEEHFSEYELIYNYYFADNGSTMKSIGEKQNITKQAVNNRLKRAYAHLKKYIIYYKSKK